MAFDKYVRGNVLSLMKRTINISELISFLQSRTDITELNSMWNEIGDEGAKELAKLTNLSSLNLEGNKISDEGAKALARLSDLSSLNLEGNYIGIQGRELAGLKDFSYSTKWKRVAHLSSFRSLDLSQRSNEGIKELAKLINLSSLNLSANNVGNEGIEALTKSSLSNLTSLSLSNNKIGDEGIEALANSSLSNLTSLRLDHNQISDKGVKALANSSLLSLTSLDLDYNQISDIGRTEVKKLLVAHLIKLKGFEAKKPDYLVQPNSDLAREISEYWDKCLDEVKKMKEEKVGGDITFYSILVSKSIDKLVCYMRNEQLAQVLERSNYRNKFPIYANDLDYLFKVAKQRVEALNIGETVIKHFDGLSKGGPAHLQIAEHLSNEDLKNLRKAAIQTMNGEDISQSLGTDVRAESAAKKQVIAGKEMEEKHRMLNKRSTRRESSPIATLKAQAKKFNFSKLGAKENNRSVNSGEQTYKDINRMDFVINGKDVDQDFINQLYKKHTRLIENNKDGEKNYRLFAKEVFKEMFKYAEAEVPNLHILEELTGNCNQAGYESIYTPFITGLYGEHELLMNVNGSNVDRKVYIDCSNPDSVKVECKVSKAPVTLPSAFTGKICDISFSLQFVLESQNGKEGVTYREGKLSLAIPKELKNYQNGDKSLFDIIKEYFQKFCEILGFTCEGKIKHNLGDPLKVDSHLENVELPDHEKSHFLGD